LRGIRRERIHVSVSHLLREPADGEPILSQLHNLVAGQLHRSLHGDQVPTPPSGPAEAHDQPRTQAKRRLSVLLRAVEALDDGRKWNPASRASLGIKEDLCVDRVLGMSLPEVRHREVVEILLGEQKIPEGGCTYAQGAGS
jgi:hypothetical protein